jgi:hypothetical protein
MASRLFRRNKKHKTKNAAQPPTLPPHLSFQWAATNDGGSTLLRPPLDADDEALLETFLPGLRTYEPWEDEGGNYATVITPAIAARDRGKVEAALATAWVESGEDLAARFAAGAAPRPAAAALGRGLFHWGQTEDGHGTTIAPPLSPGECAAIQDLFSDPLNFAAGVERTTIRPHIAEVDLPLLEEVLLEHWQRAGVAAPAANGRQIGVGDAEPAGRQIGVVDAEPAAPPRPAEFAPTELAIVFTPAAMAKYQYMATAQGGRTEVGGFGVHTLRTRGDKRTLYVTEFVTVAQTVSPARCTFDPDAVNDLTTARCLADASFNPNQLLAVWCHTHPDFGVSPSGIDWATFADHDGADYAAMVILNKKGETSGHIRFNTPFGPAIYEVPVTVDYEATAESAAGFDPAAWAAEFQANLAPAIAAWEQSCTAGWGGWGSWQSKSAQQGRGRGGTAWAGTAAKDARPAPRDLLGERLGAVAPGAGADAAGAQGLVYTDIERPHRGRRAAGLETFGDLGDLTEQELDLAFEMHLDREAAIP